MKRIGYLLPLFGLAIIAVYLALGLEKNPQELPSVLINKPVPPFSLPPIKGQVVGLSSADFQGRVTLVNIFGSWCGACVFEHPFLMKIKNERLIPIYGINWREKNRTSGPLWLERTGNPYDLIGDDPNSVGAIAFGVTGAPESFLVDKNGIIRIKRAGPITKEYWNDILWPLIKNLRGK